MKVRPASHYKSLHFPTRRWPKNFAAKLARAGEPTGWGTVELPGRGHWTRVFVGSFKTIGAARGYGEALVARGIVAEYLVKTAYDVKSLSRPRTVSSSTGGNPVAEQKRAVLNSTAECWPGSAHCCFESRRRDDQRLANFLADRSEKLQLGDAARSSRR